MGLLLLVALLRILSLNFRQLKQVILNIDLDLF